MRFAAQNCLASKVIALTPYNGHCTIKRISAPAEELTSRAYIRSRS